MRIRSGTGILLAIMLTVVSAATRATRATPAHAAYADPLVAVATGNMGLTTSGDADDDGVWGEKRAILSGWVYGDTGAARYNDARVAFIDYTNPAAPKYRWVYLVDPNSTGSTYTAAKTHIGGMIWYGDKLIVNAVGNGTVALRVLSMSHILRTTSNQATIGKVSDGLAAYNYEFVMPQIGYYTYTSGACSMSSDTAVPCFSSISLDRSTSPDSLVTAESFADQTKRGRVVEPGVSQWCGQSAGVLSFGGTWFLAHSSATSLGQLWGFATDESAGRVKTCPSGTGTTTTTMCWALHPEALMGAPHARCSRVTASGG